MKINIGPYRSDLIPTKAWREKYESSRIKEFGDIHERAEWKWFDHLIYGSLAILDNIVAPLNNYFNNKPRKIKIEYADYDTWNLDHTLALIILPGLKQLKSTNHGYAHVSNDDLPTACLKDASGEERWEWVMDEIIWAFQELVNDKAGSDAFSSGVQDFVWKKSSNNLYKMEYGPNHTFSVDSEGLNRYNDRIQRGLNLFGKYYQALWD